MKYFFLLIIALLFGESHEEFNMTKRIEKAVIYMLSTLENIAPYDSRSVTLKYSKYKIFFNNFRIISPITDNISLSKFSEDSNIYIFNNITFGFIYDITIYFAQEKYTFIKDNYLESTFTSMSFKFDENYDFLSFESFGDLNSDNNLLKFNMDINLLDFFKEFNERKPCLSIIDKEETQYQLRDPNEFIMTFLQNLTKKFYIKKVEDISILLSYDAYEILNNSLGTIDCSDKTKNKYHIIYITINKILIPHDEIELNRYLKSKLLIHQLKIIGKYFSSKHNTEIDFKVELDESNAIILYNKKVNFYFDKLIYTCFFCKEHPEELESLKFAFENDYGNYIKEIVNNYYQ